MNDCTARYSHSMHPLSQTHTMAQYRVLTSEGSVYYSEEYASMYCCTYATCICIGSIGGLVTGTCSW